MKQKTTFNIKEYIKNISPDLLNNPDIRSAIEQLKNAATLLATQISQHITYNILQDTVLAVRPAPISGPAQQKNTRKTKSSSANWTNATKPALSSALFYRKKHNLPVEPELQQALAAAFPGYDPATHTIKKTFTKRAVRTTNWAKSSKQTLCAALGYRNRRNLPVEPELNDALVAAFPGYDPALKKITKRTRARRITNTDWSTKTRRQLQVAFYNHKHTNKPISAEFNNALVATFPNYDAEKQSFVRIKKQKKAQTPQKSASTPDLDAAQHNDIQAQTPQKSASTPDKKLQNAILPLYSKKTISGNYCLVFNDGTSERNLLTASKIPYELYFLDTKTKTAIVRKMSNKQNTVFYLLNYTSGKLFQDTATGVQHVAYTETTHDIYTKKHRDSSQYFLHLTRNGKTNEHVLQLPHDAKTLRPGETIIIDDNGNITTHPLVILGSASEHQQQNEIIKKITTPASIPTSQTTETVAASITPEQPAQRTPSVPKKATTNTNLLSVTIKPVKTTLDGTYNDVFVNGKKILSNHFNTEIKLLMNDTILAIHGIVTDNHDLPQTPIWQVYGPDLRSRIALQKQKFSGYNIHAKYVTETANGLRMELSNRCSCLLKTERLLKEAGQKRFVIQDEHTR